MRSSSAWSRSRSTRRRSTRSSRAIAGGEEDGSHLDVLHGARVVLGVTGGIAAYKAVEVLRRLVGHGAHVVPVLTEAATHFVGEATFSALASEPVEMELFGGVTPIPHTRLGRQADVIVVAPATARVIGEYAAGISADLLGATLLATRAPVVLCPAMHTEMWEHPAVRDNVATLRSRGVHLVEPESGRLAGGDVGEGRLADPARIVAAVAGVLAARGRAIPEPRSDLAGLVVLVTAGGTREPIDPVRYIANRSSGRQGHALAEVAAQRGATVVLVSASELPPPPGVTTVHVETAAELAEAVLERSGSADVVIMAAAVADFRPVDVSVSKIHKSDGVPEIHLEPTLDVLAELGRRRQPGQVVVGFAAETDEALERGRAKLVAKGADLVVVNDVTTPGAGFGHETNAVTLLYASGTTLEVPCAPKRTIAAAVLDAVTAIRRDDAPMPSPDAGARGPGHDEGAVR
ncbi:MAG: bifunctional phosphopantothenoylcysteine decarboxylase/phosphopantothenate--cysteine ligase CoaBC [Acidimicrobiales bacterium]